MDAIDTRKKKKDNKSDGANDGVFSVSSIECFDGQNRERAA